jgi:hypothetical protein
MNWYQLQNTKATGGQVDPVEERDAMMALQQHAPDVLNKAVSGVVTTNMVTFARARQAILNGEDVDVTALSRELSQTHMHELIKLQQDVDSGAAQTMTKRRALEAVNPLVQKAINQGVKDPGEVAQNTLTFMRRLEGRIEAFRENNGGKMPGDKDIEVMTNTLLLQGRGGVQLYKAPPGEDFTIPGIPRFDGNVTISGVDFSYEELVSSIVEDLTDKGFDVTPENIKMAYRRAIEGSRQ